LNAGVQLFLQEFSNFGIWLLALLHHLQLISNTKPILQEEGSAQTLDLALSHDSDPVS